MQRSATYSRYTYPLPAKSHNVRYLPSALGNLLQTHWANDRSFNWSWYEQYSNNRMQCRRGPVKQGRSKSNNFWLHHSVKIICNDCRNTVMLSYWVHMQWTSLPKVEADIIRKFGHLCCNISLHLEHQTVSINWSGTLHSIKNRSEKRYWWRVARQRHVSLRGPVQDIAVNVQDVANMAGFTLFKFPISSWNLEGPNVKVWTITDIWMSLYLIGMAFELGGYPAYDNTSPYDTPRLVRSLLSWKEIVFLLSLGLPLS